MELVPYLGFTGQCEAAFRFYEQCLGGKITALVRFEGSPAAEHVPTEMRSQIMHARLEANGAVLMGSDGPSEEGAGPGSTYVSLHLTDPAEAERIFQALSEGGKVQMPMEETFWAARFGMAIDRFGTPWMVNCEKAG